MHAEQKVNRAYKVTEKIEEVNCHCICKPRLPINNKRKRYIQYKGQVSSKVLEDRDKLKEVCKIRIFALDRYGYPLCPTCQMPMEREYMNYCSYCGQKLSWKQYRYGHIEIEQIGLDVGKIVVKDYDDLPDSNRNLVLKKIRVQSTGASDLVKAR